MFGEGAGDEDAAAAAEADLIAAWAHAEILAAAALIESAAVAHAWAETTRGYECEWGDQTRERSKVRGNLRRRRQHNEECE
jgi:hypothetical protein